MFKSSQTQLNALEVTVRSTLCLGVVHVSRLFILSGFVRYLLADILLDILSSFCVDG